MGLFDSGDDDVDTSAQTQANYLLTQQINQNKDELEQKRQSLVDQRTNILKSQGAETWAPNRNQAYAGHDATTEAQSGGQQPSGGWWNNGLWK